MKFTRLTSLLLAGAFVMSLSSGALAQGAAKGGEAPKTAAPAKPKRTPAPPTTTPLTLEHAETFIYRQGEEPVRLFVYKPKGWKATDKRPVFIYFFGGGFVRGNPEKSAGWGRWATRFGMVGVAADYRVKERYKNVHPADTLADGRLAVRWLQEHAAELGIDPAKVIVGGSSAGGGVALWTSLSTVPPHSTAADTPLQKPAAVILLSAVSDTSTATGYGAKRFEEFADAASGAHHLDAKMPPMLVFHGDADETVPYDQTKRLTDKLTATGNSVQFVTVPKGTHGFTTDLPEWKDKSRDMIKDFLVKQGLITEPAAKK